MIDNIKKQNEDLDFEIQKQMTKVLKNHYEAIELLTAKVLELEKKINGLVQ